jgi:tetratricopeptide (TPR) repeat protein
MRHHNPSRTTATTVLGLLLLAAPALAQYREYYVRGRVVDEQKNPVPNVQIDLLDPATSRAFHFKTDKKGEFKYAGLPHAAYKVTFTCEGYATATDEWDFNAKQDRMQRVDVPDVVLASAAHVREVQRVTGAKAGIEEAAEKIGKGDLDGAIAAAEKVLEKSPDDPNALYYLGLAHVGQKAYSDAVGPLTQVTQLSPEFPGAWVALGDCYRQLGEPEKALAAYEKNLALEPANATAAYNSGLILFEQNRIDEAQARFEAGLAAHPDDPDFNDMLGRCLLNGGKIAEALQHFEKARAATTDPDKAKLLDSLIEQARAVKH